MYRSTVTERMASLPNAKVTELKLLLSTDVNEKKTIVLVEGPDDKKLYSQFVSDEHVVLFPLGGCGNMPEVILMAKDDEFFNDRLIGIKDADFDHITAKNYGFDNLFVTDTHDWETMVMTDSCECKLSIEVLGRKEKNIFLRVMNDIANYSYIRLYNEVEICQQGLDGISFRGLKISNLYDGNTTCSLSDCLQIVRNHGNNNNLPHFPTEQQIENFKLRYPDVDMLNLTCGHDVMHCVVCRFRFLLNKPLSVGYSNLEALSRVSYSIEFFRATNLYKSVDSWSKTHGRIIWAA